MLSLLLKIFMRTAETTLTETHAGIAESTPPRQFRRHSVVPTRAPIGGELRYRQIRSSKTVEEESLRTVAAPESSIGRECANLPFVALGDAVVVMH